MRVEEVELRGVCARARRDALEMICRAGSGHPGGSLSCMEILATLYFRVMRVNPQMPDWPLRDRFVLSKGHAAPALYAILAARGYFDRSNFAAFRQLGGMLQGHPDRKRTPGVDMSTGSLGQGLSAAVGMALGARRLGLDSRVYALLGDGETQEGIVWEALSAASHYQLDRLTVIIDRNGLQIDGTNEQVMSPGDMNARLAAFGMHVIDVPDGHDISALERALCAQAPAGMPRCVVAHTVKGKGVSFMENEVEWHGRALTQAELDLALIELGGML